MTLQHFSTAAFRCLARRLLPALLLGLVMGAARASEGGFVAGPVGGADIRAALLPPPGTYGIGMLFGTRVVDLRAPDGSRSPAGIKGHNGGMALGVAHVFDADVAGGRVAAMVIGIGLNACIYRRGTGHTQCRTGQGDTYAEVLWSRPLGELGLAGPAADDPRRMLIPYGLTVSASLATMIPTSQYRTRDISPLGFNTWVVAPGIGMTWISPPWLLDGTELSARFGYNIHARNHATGYQAGDMAVIDWAITERLGPYQFGATGSWARQVETDRLNGVRVASTSVTGFGAIAAMDIPAWRAFTSLKYVQDTEARYRVRLNRVWWRFVMQF